MEIIIFVPKLYSDRPSSELRPQSQLPVSSENLVSKGGKQSNCDQEREREFGSECWLSKGSCKTSDTRGKYTSLAKRRPRVPGNRKVFYVSSYHSRRSVEEVLFTSLRFEVSGRIYLP